MSLSVQQNPVTAPAQLPNPVAGKSTVTAENSQKNSAYERSITVLKEQIEKIAGLNVTKEHKEEIIRLQKGFDACIALGNGRFNALHNVSLKKEAECKVLKAERDRLQAENARCLSLLRKVTGIENPLESIKKHSPEIEGFKLFFLGNSKAVDNKKALPGDKAEVKITEELSKDKLAADAKTPPAEAGEVKKVEEPTVKDKKELPSFSINDKMNNLYSRYQKVIKESNEESLTLLFNDFAECCRYLHPTDKPRIASKEEFEQHSAAQKKGLSHSEFQAISHDQYKNLSYLGLEQLVEHWADKQKKCVLATAFANDDFVKKDVQYNGGMVNGDIKKIQNEKRESSLEAKIKAYNQSLTQFKEIAAFLKDKASAFKWLKSEFNALVDELNPIMSPQEKAQILEEADKLKALAIYGEKKATEMREVRLKVQASQITDQDAEGIRKALFSSISNDCSHIGCKEILTLENSLRLQLNNRDKTLNPHLSAKTSSEWHMPFASLYKESIQNCLNRCEESKKLAKTNLQRLYDNINFFGFVLDPVNKENRTIRMGEALRGYIQKSYMELWNASAFGGKIIREEDIAKLKDEPVPSGAIDFIQAEYKRLKLVEKNAQLNASK